MTAVADYIAALDRAYRRGDATEHTYRPALQALLESRAANIEATNEPQRIAGNAPDFVVRRNATILGHVEAKDIDEPLDKLLKSAQLKRYAEALPNLVFTDYLDFIWLEHGEPKLRARLGEVTPRGIVPVADAEEQWNKLAQAFYNAVAPVVATPKQLAKLLAAQTQLLRDATLETLHHEGDAGALAGQHKAFREMLVPELAEAEFADMFAQTVAYGLFTARVFDPTPQDFSLREAETLIPKASPFLRQLFRFIAFDLSDGIKWIAETIVDALQHADLDKVLHRQSRKRGFTDPIFHFYETFLAEYDPALRESRGVYYTPEPVVDFIVRGIEHLLKTEFGKAAGLADPDTIILDPATGTATFLREVIDRIYRHEVDAGMRGAWPDYVREKLLPRVFGFELMMAPYTVAHLKLALELADRGFEFKGDDRLNVFLTNTLDRIAKQIEMPFGRWLAQEAEGAERVKDKLPVEVVLGNPPYSGISTNNSDWIKELIKLYKREPDGSKLKERKHWLNDDYVKFIRFAHWRIEKTGHGIVGFIANHSWLDNPTFRGMRAALKRDFDAIYVLDLHGNSKKKEKTPTTHARYGDDKNVFDIEQGVAILFLIRKRVPSSGAARHLLPEGEGKKLEPLSPRERRPQAERVALGEGSARVYHAEFWGSRESKYQRLEDGEFEKMDWRELDPQLPHLPFVPVSLAGIEDYQRGWSVTSIFLSNVTGIVTARDDLVYDFAASGLESKIERFLDPGKSDDQVRHEFFPNKKEGKYLPGDSRGWKLSDARQKLRLLEWRPAITPCLYRPFDRRALLYIREMVDWGRWDAMPALSLDGLNVALIAPRQVKEDWAVFCSSTIGGHKTCSAYDINYYFPLWLLPEHDTLDPAKNARHPNLDPRYLTALAGALGMGVTEPFGLPEGMTPEDIFHFIYAVLHAPTYRSRYAEYLRSDFPRIPLPPDLKTFCALAALGEKLVALHLLRDPSLQQGGAAYPVAGDHEIEKVRYEPGRDGSPGKVWINARQYFEGIDPDTFAFRVGGYQVLEKWLKDRKGRKLSRDEIEHYRRIVLALSGTRELMTQVDVAAAPLFAAATPEPEGAPA